MSNTLVIIKVFFYIVFCLYQPAIYYWWKALGFRLLGALSLYEHEHYTFLNKVLPGGLTAIDIGAHLGVYSTLLVKKLGANGKLMLFEPYPYCFQYLEQAFRDNPKVSVYSNAISNVNTELFLRIPKLFGIVPEAAIAQVVSAPEAGCVRITTRTLDSFIEKLDRLDFIKVDIEGHELSFFEGARQIISKFRPLVLFEDNNIEHNLAAYKKLTAEFNYELCQLNENGELRLYDSTVKNEYNFYLRPVDVTK